MDYVWGIFLLLVSSILVNNFILSRILGICPFLGVSSQMSSAVGMGIAVTFVMGMASVITYLVQYFLLVPLHIEYMQTIAFILVIAALVQLVEMILQKSSPTLYQALGVYLPLITTNCAVLGVTIINITQGYDLFQTFISGVGGALGFMLAIVLFAGIRERLATSPIGKPFQGFPIWLINASLMSMGFLGFTGLVK